MSFVFSDFSNFQIVKTLFWYNTVKLGYYVHGFVLTLGYNVLSVDHGHRQSENMYIFFFGEDVRKVAQNRIFRTNIIFPPRTLFCPFFGSFVSDHEHVIQPFSFDFNFPARFQVHDALKGDFTVRKANNERHSGRRSIFCGRLFAWTRGTGPASEEIRVLDRTYRVLHKKWDNLCFRIMACYKAWTFTFWGSLTSCCHSVLMASAKNGRMHFYRVLC